MGTVSMLQKVHKKEYVTEAFSDRNAPESGWPCVDHMEATEKHSWVNVWHELSDEEHEVLNKETHQCFFVKCQVLDREEWDKRWRSWEMEIVKMVITK